MNDYMEISHALEKSQLSITLIVAVAVDGCIGRRGCLPWHLPADLKRFKAMTMGKPVLMGRVTWQGLPRKPLVGRQNIVLSRNVESLDGADVVDSLDNALLVAQASMASELVVIGGSEVYKLTLPFANRIFMTKVATRVEDGDAFFPELGCQWQQTSCQTAQDCNPACCYLTLERR